MSIFSLVEQDRTQSGSRSDYKHSKQAADPNRVDQLVSELQQLIHDNGVGMPSGNAGSCQYKLGSHKQSLRMRSNRLLIWCIGGRGLCRVPQAEF